MDAAARLAAVTATLLVAGSVAGLLLTDGALPQGLTLGAEDAEAVDASDCSAPAEFAFPSDAEVETWSGEVPADASGGTVEANAWYGGVHVAPSEDDSYRVEIAEDDPNDNLEPTVDASTEGGTFSLDVDVEHANRQDLGPSDVSVGVQDGRAHVKVWVPAKTYEAIEADSTPDANGSHNVRIHLHPETDVMEDEDEPDDAVVVRGLEADGKVEADAYNRPAGLEDVAAGKALADSYDGLAAATDVVVDGNLTVDSYDGKACALAAESGTLRVDSYEGAATASDVAAATVVLDSYEGPAVAEDVETSDLLVDSYNGKAVASLVPSGSGEAVADSYNGMAKLAVATGPTYGYDAVADAYNGDAVVDLPDASTYAEDEGHGSDQVRAKTNGYEDRPVQVNLTADSYDGDAIVTGLSP